LRSDAIEIWIGVRYLFAYGAVTLKRDTLMEEVDDLYTVSVTGNGTSVTKKVGEELAAAVIALIMTGKTAPSVGARNTTLASSAQSSRVSLREFMDGNAPSSNAEKIVAIGRYMAAHENKPAFSSQDLLGHFRAARESVPANISRDIASAIKSGWIAEDPQVTGSYYVTQKGEKSFDSRTTVRSSNGSEDLGTEEPIQSATESRVRRRRTGGGKVAQWTIVDTLLDEKGRAALKEFYNQKQPNGQNEQVAVLTYKLKELTGRPGFNGNEVYTALQVVGARTPGNLAAVFGNMATSGYGRIVDKAFHPGFKTDDLVKLDLPRKPAAKADNK
jgi:hypothetical protein